METSKRALGLLSLTLILVSFSQCASTQKLQKKSPTIFGETYFQKWVAGVEGGGSGLNIFIEVKDDAIQLDSVYFRGKGVDLKTHPKNESLYVGSFVSQSQNIQDLTMSSDSKTEYGNKMPEKPVKIPFELAFNECVVSYKAKGETKYYKLINVAEIHSIDVPM